MKLSQYQAQIATLTERIKSLDAKLDAAHLRIDKTEILINEDFKEIKKDLKELNLQFLEISKFLERGKGWAGAALLLAGVIGGGVSKAISHVVYK